MLAGPDSGLELRAFAAPRCDGIWDEVRKDIAAEATKRGGTATELDGEFGTELKLVVPVQTPDGKQATQTSRIVGVDGPRWLLRGTFLGKSAREPDPEGVVEQRLPRRHRRARRRPDGSARHDPDAHVPQAQRRRRRRWSRMRRTTPTRDGRRGIGLAFGVRWRHESRRRAAGRFRRALKQLAATADEMEADELDHERVDAGGAARHRGAHATASYVTVYGHLKNVSLAPRAGTPTLEATLYDGSGVVTLVWLGRRKIVGIKPGVAWSPTAGSRATTAGA